MNQDTDATSGRHLRGRYAIVGVGETGYTRGNDCTARVPSVPRWRMRG